MVLWGIKNSFYYFILLFYVGFCHAAIKINTTKTFIETEKTFSGKAYSSMMWLKIDSNAKRGCFVTVGDKGVLNPSAFGFWVEPKIKRIGFWNGLYKHSDENILPLDRWIHLAVSGTTEKSTNFYINGELIWTSHSQNSIKNAVGRIGSALDGQDPTQGVSYDEVSFWARELDESEVKANYNNGKGRALSGGETGLKVYWKCEPASGNSLADSQLNGKMRKGVISGKAGVDYEWVDGVKVAEPLSVVNPVPTLKAEALSESSIKVNWGTLDEASGYELTVSKNSSLKSPLYRGIMKGNSKLFKDLKSQTNYYFSVRTEREGEFSPRMTVERSTYCLPIKSGNTRYYHYQWENGGRFHITDVSTKGGVNGQNISSSVGTNVKEYLSDYSHQAVKVTRGKSFDLAITLKDLHGNYVGGRLWIDWNCDGDFDDENELVQTLGSLGLNKRNRSQTYNLKVKVPAGAVEGLARMRIRVADSGSKEAEKLDSQGVYKFTGVAHDYTVMIGDAANVAASSQKVTEKAATTVKEYKFAPKIRSGHILKAGKLSARKIRWVARNGSHSYLNPKPGMKFVEMFVRIKKGFSISVADYLLSNSIRTFTAKCISTNLTGTEFKEFNQIGEADKKSRVFRLLYEVPDNIDVFDVVFALETSVKQPSVEGLSFTQTKPFSVKQ